MRFLGLVGRFRTLAQLVTGLVPPFAAVAGFCLGIPLTPLPAFGVLPTPLTYLGAEEEVVPGISRSNDHRDRYEPSLFN